MAYATSHGSFLKRQPAGPRHSDDVKLGGGLCPLNRAVITLNRDLRTNDGQASRPVVDVIERRQRLYAIRRATQSYLAHDQAGRTLGAKHHYLQKRLLW